MVAGRNGDVDTVAGRFINLRRPANPADAAHRFVVRPQQTRCHQFVEMECRQLPRNSHRGGGFVTGDRTPRATTEFVQPAA